ncbi:hypothetical protein M409DRAFT_28043 [Zasmidium cellare ATCC 36951]|uniref:Uncharacterized protein n=1 Tax=Zasmidium cellare ATCC 36951 TaxID=1080233 RepID=A0A6A6C5W2_ZASCE|nr:uncharacterized protein M409DRAFT_28043 [Zasmidium cellare ATCC 36951]KAF2161648.1 hypothetical protein M409DRAFT_28043 [Zasmidium cellare ATCC 36951]
MPEQHSHINLPSLHAASKNLNHMLHRHSPTSSPAHIGTASKANQIFHDEVRARHIQDQDRSSRFVDQSESDAEMRPPRYGQVVDEHLNQTRHVRKGEMLESNTQDPSTSSLVVDHSTSKARPPPRYSQVIDKRAQRHGSGRGKHDVRGEENLARQVQEGYNSSLAVNDSISSPGSTRRTRPQTHHPRRRDEALGRQIQDQYNSSLLVNNSISTSTSTSHPKPKPPINQRRSGPQTHHPRRDEALPRQHQNEPNSSVAITQHTTPNPQYISSSPPPTYLTHTLFNPPPSYHLQPGHHTPYTILVDEGDDIYPWTGPETKTSRKEENRKKKPQIRAKDHEGALRWLACRRGLGGS